MNYDFTYFEVGDLGVAELWASVVAELDIPLAGQRVDEVGVLLDDGVEDVLVGQTGRQKRHEVALGNQPPQVTPPDVPQLGQLKQNHPRVETPTQRGPRPVLLPQLAQVPVALVLHQADRLMYKKCKLILENITLVIKWFKN